MNRVAKHSSQKFDINTRNIHKGIFSCNLWWFVGVCNSRRDILTCNRSGLVCFTSFCLLVSGKFGKNMIFSAS